MVCLNEICDVYYCYNYYCISMTKSLSSRVRLWKQAPSPSGRPQRAVHWTINRMGDQDVSWFIVTIMLSVQHGQPTFFPTWETQKMTGYCCWTCSAWGIGTGLYNGTPMLRRSRFCFKASMAACGSTRSLGGAIERWKMVEKKAGKSMEITENYEQICFLYGKILDILQNLGHLKGGKKSISPGWIQPCVPLTQDLRHGLGRQHKIYARWRTGLVIFLLRSSKSTWKMLNMT